MNLAALFYFLLFNGVVAVITLKRMKKERILTSEGFFLGNRSLGFVMIGGLLFLTNVNGIQFIGENESVYLNNMTVMAWGMTSVVAMLIVSEFFMPIYLKMGIITTPDYLEHRYDTGIKRWVSIVFLVSYLINMLPPILYGGAVVFNGIFRFSDWLGVSSWSIMWVLVWAIGLIGLIYTAMGGIKLIAMSDVLLGGGLLIIGTTLPYFGLKYLGNGDFGAGVATLLGSKTQHFQAIGSEKDAIPFTTLFTGMLLINLNYWGMEQYIVQRALSSRNLAEGQKGITLAALGKLLSPLMINIPGVIAVHLYPTIENTAEVFPRLASDVLPSILTGLTAAVIFGSAVTGFNAGLNSSSTLFVLNIYKPMKEKYGVITDRELVSIGKRFQIFAAFWAMLVAPFIFFAKGGFYNYLQMVGGAFSVPIFTILVVGFLTKRVPPLAAKVGLVFFVTAYLVSQTLLDLKLHFLHVLAILFIVTVIIMLLIGKKYPLVIPYKPIDKKIVDVRPWEHRHIYGLILIIILVAIYALFSTLGLVKA